MGETVLAGQVYEVEAARHKLRADDISGKMRGKKIMREKIF
jgi:hypothetical protein